MAAANTPAAAKSTSIGVVLVVVVVAVVVMTNPRTDHRWLEGHAVVAEGNILFCKNMGISSTRKKWTQTREKEPVNESTLEKED